MTSCLQIYVYAMCTEKGMIKYSEISIDVIDTSTEFVTSVSYLCVNP